MITPKIEDRVLENLLNNINEADNEILKKSGLTRLTEKKQTDQQLVKVANRIRLLKMEYHKKQKKIVETKNRIQQRDEVRKQIEEYKNIKVIHKLEAEEALRSLQNKTQLIRAQAEYDRQLLKESIERLRKEEYEEIKNMSIRNDKFIEKSKHDKQALNVKKRQNIKFGEQNSIKAIQMYKKLQQDTYKKEQNQNKLEFLSQRQQNDLKLIQLEQQEIDWLNKLQRTCELEQNLKIMEKNNQLKTKQRKNRSPQNEVNPKLFQITKFPKRSSSNKSTKRTFNEY